ncbi:MAG: c-type cytochrome [Rhodospirillaceae bacterium]|nr:c-type cytochrome [Rhodospirillaceae bacterium]
MMRNCKLMRGFFTALLALGIFSAVPGLAAAQEGTKAVIYGDKERGQAIAAKWCAHCHAIHTASANDQVPSLPVVATRHKGQPAVLRAFLHAPHKPMPPLQLTNQEIEDLAVFIEAIK